MVLGLRVGWDPTPRTKSLDISPLRDLRVLDFAFLVAVVCHSEGDSETTPSGVPATVEGRCQEIALVVWREVGAAAIG